MRVGHCCGSQTDSMPTCLLRHARHGKITVAAFVRYGCVLVQRALSGQVVAGRALGQDGCLYRSIYPSDHLILQFICTELTGRTFSIHRQKQNGRPTRAGWSSLNCAHRSYYEEHAAYAILRGISRGALRPSRAFNGHLPASAMQRAAAAGDASLCHAERRAERLRASFGLARWNELRERALRFYRIYGENHPPVFASLSCSSLLSTALPCHASGVNKSSRFCARRCAAPFFRNDACNRRACPSLWATVIMAFLAFSRVCSFDSQPPNFPTSLPSPPSLQVSLA